MTNQPTSFLEELKQREKTSWKPLRGEGNTDTTYPVLSADAADACSASSCRSSRCSCSCSRRLPAVITVSVMA